VSVPLALDTGDGARDGTTRAAGTSFSAPIVTGAAAWVRAARPSLSAGQVADVLRFGARDVGPSGWDADTGFGLVDLGAALREPAPAEDPGEPNDDIPMVDGRWFAGADRPIFTGTGTRSVRATVDDAEDPTDVFRIRMPARSAARIVLRPSFGDPDLYVFGAAARSLASSRRILARSVRASGVDRVVVRNAGRRTATRYVVVAEGRHTGQITAGYRLVVQRVRAR
jgi:subtilase family protein